MTDELIDPNLPPGFAAREVKATLTVHSTSQGTPRSEVKVRHFTMQIDEPPERHGTDTGPSPLEHVLAALAA